MVRELKSSGFCLALSYDIMLSGKGGLGYGIYWVSMGASFVSTGRYLSYIFWMVGLVLLKRIDSETSGTKEWQG